MPFGMQMRIIDDHGLIEFDLRDATA